MREIAVRQALGAPLSALLAQIIKSALVVAGVGMVLGLAMALASMRLISFMLFQVNWRDPATLSAVCAAVFVSALAACIAPAWRAAHADPLITLREA